MARYVPIRFNDEEAACLERSFAASEDSALSTHIKRIYFDAVRLDVDMLQDLRRDMNRIDASVERLRERQAEAIGQGAGEDTDLLLGILCGLYVMVRKSVGDSIRAQADQALDISAIEGYLKGR
jgi:tetrahydromethanopterin S-methyltransferase subunit G